MDDLVTRADQLGLEAGIPDEDLGDVKQALATAKRAMRTYRDLRGRSDSAAMPIIIASSTAIAADDATVVGTADDVLLIPLALAAVVVHIFGESAPTVDQLGDAWWDVGNSLDKLSKAIEMAKAKAKPKAVPIPVDRTKPKDDEKEKPKHRGRIQVQGGGLEKSRPWFQDSPRTKVQGELDLVSLKGELSKSEVKERDEAFAEAAAFIAATIYTAPPDLHRTFRNPEVRQRRGDERVDIEIHQGTAFV